MVVQAEAPTERDASPRYDPRRQAIVDDLIFNQLDRSLKARDAIHARRLAKRSREGTPASGSGRPRKKPAHRRKPKPLTQTVRGPSEASMEVDREHAGSSTEAGPSTRRVSPAEEELVDYESDVRLEHSDDEDAQSNAD